MHQSNKYLSLAELIFKSLTKMKLPIEDCVGFSTEFKDCYVKPSHYQGFNSLFTQPERLISFAFIASFKSIIQTIAIAPIPARLIGLVHINNSVSQLKGVNWLLPYNVKNQITNIEQNEKGVFYTISTELLQGNELKLTMENVFLEKNKHYKRSKTSASEKANEYTQTTKLGTFQVNQKTAWLYAKASGDFNPIHVNRYFAKLLGMKSSLMHGMYNVHRSLFVTQENSGIEVNNYQVEFNKPCLLPTICEIVQQNDNIVHLFKKGKNERYLELKTKKEA